MCADSSCPYCLKRAETIASVMEAHEARVRMVIDEKDKLTLRLHAAEARAEAAETALLRLASVAGRIAEIGLMGQQR